LLWQLNQVFQKVFKDVSETTKKKTGKPLVPEEMYPAIAPAAEPTGEGEERRGAKEVRREKERREKEIGAGGVEVRRVEMGKQKQYIGAPDMEERERRRFELAREKGKGRDYGVGEAGGYGAEER
jgi:hypothetical protein